MDFAGTTVVVTGGTDGIGRELCIQLQRAGASVITCGRSPARVAAARELGHEAIEADLSRPAGVEALLHAVGDRPIDILVNNAGASSAHDFRTAPPDLDANDATIFLNLQAPIHLITRLMPMLRSRPRAMIVNVTSGLAIAPRAASPIYCATKAALRAYTMALRHQLRETSVHVLEVLPPVVATKMTQSRSGGKMSAEQCARDTVAAMRKEADEANIGVVKVLRLVESTSPALARRIMIRF